MNDFYEKRLSEMLGRIADELKDFGLEPELVEEIIQEVENRVPLEDERESA